jgi:PTH1 family peptidyl-tRNA hydrolase
MFIVGLGNPGSKYSRTRHNAGKIFTTWLSDRVSNLKILKLNSFMNKSGPALKKALKFHPVNTLIVAHDDLDLPLGKFKLQLNKGPKDHKGLNSIYRTLGTKNFWHLRLGINNRSPSIRDQISGNEYVLKNFSQSELQTLKSTFSMIENCLNSFN